MSIEAPFHNRREIHIKGIVQGVGFRPHVYNLAKTHGLAGYVLNDIRGVQIEVEGAPEVIARFEQALRSAPPPRAVITDFISRDLPATGYGTFEIRHSDAEGERTVLISPDIATCPECLTEMHSRGDYRYRYPFINCTNCGPRFTIIMDVPYDRAYTSMASFPMCPVCREEYENPETRRFHAQPNACARCGPSLSLRGASGDGEVLSMAARLLREGKILAVKGLGGYHLACDAFNEDAVRNLRSRKVREDKPFALMAATLEEVKSLCTVSPEEERLLTGFQRPIVLMTRHEGSPVAPSVAPGTRTLGVMLPYTPLHHLLLEDSGLVLVMTSGNLCDEPIAYDDSEAEERLGPVADAFLVHNRDIYMRCDDSVARVVDGKELVLRRSRGYVPFPISLESPFPVEILATGGELKNTFCFARGNQAFVSHHIGDLENLETLESFEKGIDHFRKIFYLDPQVVAYDMHPRYLSTQYALRYPAEMRFPVQHHHAHIVSVMAENNVEGPVIGVAWDGTGFGDDGHLWGSEFLVCTSEEYRRCGHLRYIPMPGGERAVREPWRMAAAYLDDALGPAMWELRIPFIEILREGNWQVLAAAVKKGIGSPLTSGAGRLFDAVSALAGICRTANYEGQAAIELETTACEEPAGPYAFDILDGDGFLIDARPVIRDVVRDLEGGVPVPVISRKFHETASDMIVEGALRVRAGEGLSTVALSGGVFQNVTLLESVINKLRRRGFTVVTHGRVPPNDGGISLGQAVVASARWKQCALGSR